MSGPDARLNALDARARRAVRRLYQTFFVLFSLCVVSLTYWQVFAAGDLAENGHNPRLFDRGTGIQRGAILSSSGEPLAISAPSQEDGTFGASFARSVNLSPSIVQTIGYKNPARGATGLERTYDLGLLGLADWQWPSRLYSALTGRQRAGANLLTTIREDVQRAADNGLAGRQGAVVALDPVTGDVLAVASSPGVPPEALYDSDAWERARTDTNSPLFNRALLGTYAPGSAIKFVLLALALDAGAVRPDETFSDRGTVVVDGYVIHNAGGEAFGTVTLDEALARSSNVVFVRLGQRLSGDRLVAGLTGAGFNRRLPFDLPVTPSRVPDRSDVSGAALVEMSIGQGPIVVTPLHMAMLVAAIANGGVAPRVHIADGWVDETGRRVRKLFDRGDGQRWFSRTSARRVTAAMAAVVQDGTGAAARIPGAIVAGKTGTAENPHGADDAWFVGFAPAWDPKVAVAVVVEGGGSGGAVAAPIARQVMEAALTGAGRRR